MGTRAVLNFTLSTPIFHHSSPAFHQVSGSPLALLASLPQYNSSQKSDKGPSLPGGGLTRRFLSSIPENWSINTGFLIWMGMEGDNRDDAALVAGVLAKILSTDGQIKGHYLLCHSRHHVHSIVLHQNGRSRKAGDRVYSDH
jgi:hypothetical protein